MRLMRNQTLYESRYRKALKPILREQRKEALTNLEAIASSFDPSSSTAKSLQSSLFDVSKYDTDMQAGLSPVLVNLADQQGALALVFAGDEESEFKMTAKLVNFIRASTSKMAHLFNTETQEKLAASLAEGIGEGEALGDLKKRVNDFYDTTEGYRTMRLARTETLKVSNNATAWAYKQTGYVKAKEWYTNPGACEICDSLNGKTAGLEEEFAKLGSNIEYTDNEGNTQTYAVDYDDIENPPVHPNCRCTIVPVR